MQFHADLSDRQRHVCHIKTENESFVRQRRRHMFKCHVGMTSSLAVIITLNKI